jgi:hypothetical protein
MAEILSPVSKKKLEREKNETFYDQNTLSVSLMVSGVTK